MRTISTTLLLLIFFSCGNINTPQVNLMSDSELVEIEEVEYILVDVRTPNEYDTGYIQEAINIDFYSDSFDKNILSLEKGSKIILYCRTNNRSSKTANMLIENGYNDVNVIEGGIASWVKNGYEINYPLSE